MVSDRADTAVVSQNQKRHLHLPVHLDFPMPLPLAQLGSAPSNMSRWTLTKKGNRVWSRSMGTWKNYREGERERK